MLCIAVDGIKVGKRYRRDLGDIDTLGASIADIGLLHPVVVTPDHRLIAGQRRLEAFKKLQRKTIPVTVVDIERIVEGECAENIIRKDLTPSEAVAVWEAMKKVKTDPRKLRSKLDHSSRRRERAAKAVGLSTGTLSKAKAVVENGNKDLIAEMDRTGNVNRTHRAMKRKEDEQKILKETPILKAKGVYKTILIDPPWDYKQLDLAGRGKPRYAVMSLEDLSGLSLPSDTNCHLYLWTTNNYLHEALKLGVGWGFTYKTVVTWVKPSIGMGSYFRNSTEQCLFFVKGTLTTRVKDIPTHFSAPRGKHSEKPESIYEIIERASYPPYLELFARKRRKGWTTRGNL